MTDVQRKILCDPQTSGGLLVAAENEHSDEFIQFAKNLGLDLQPIGELHAAETDTPLITIV